MRSKPFKKKVTEKEFHTRKTYPIPVLKTTPFTQTNPNSYHSSTPAPSNHFHLPPWKQRSEDILVLNLLMHFELVEPLAKFP